MNRRHFLLAMATGLLATAARAAGANFGSTRISVLTRGTGPDVILIPGLTASRDIWAGTIAALPGYRYHLIQIAGFAGDPPRGNATGAVAAPAAAEIARYITESGLKAPAIIGHSMGGLIALMIAARWPRRVGRAMVIDMLPAPAAGMGVSVAGLGPLADGLRDALTHSPEGRRALAGLIGLFGGPESDAGKSDPGVVARATHEIATTDLTGELARITGPLTVLYATIPGAQHIDAAAVDRAYREGFANAKNAQLKRVSGSGHMIMFDQPQRFRAELGAFLTAREPGA